MASETTSAGRESRSEWATSLTSRKPRMSSPCWCTFFFGEGRLRLRLRARWRKKKKKEKKNGRDRRIDDAFGSISRLSRLCAALFYHLRPPMDRRRLPLHGGFEATDAGEGSENGEQLARWGRRPSSFQARSPIKKRKEKTKSTHVDHGRREDLVRRQRPQRRLHAVPGAQRDDGAGRPGGQHVRDFRIDQELAKLFVAHFVFVFCSSERIPRECCCVARSVSCEGASSRDTGTGMGAKKRETKERSCKKQRRESFVLLCPSLDPSRFSLVHLSQRLPSVQKKKEPGEKQEKTSRNCNFVKKSKKEKKSKDARRKRKSSTEREKERKLFFRRARPWPRPSCRPPPSSFCRPPPSLRRRAPRRARRSA